LKKIKQYAQYDDPHLDILGINTCERSHNFQDYCINRECKIKSKHTKHDHYDQIIYFFNNEKALMHCSKCHDEKLASDMI